MTLQTLAGRYPPSPTQALSVRRHHVGGASLHVRLLHHHV